MKFLILHDGAWKIVAELSDDPDSPICGLHEGFDDLGSNFQSNVDGIIAIWEQIDRRGPRALGTSLYHYVDENEQIYEFRKGRIRVLCFEADGAICVCSHALIKKDQQIRKKDIAPVIALRNRYLEAKRQGNLFFISEDELGGDDNGY